MKTVHDEKQFPKNIKTKLKTQISKEKSDNNTTQRHRSRETWPTCNKGLLSKPPGFAYLHPRGTMKLHRLQRLQRLLWLDVVGQELHWLDDVERSLIGSDDVLDDVDDEDDEDLLYSCHAGAGTMDAANLGSR